MTGDRTQLRGARAANVSFLQRGGEDATHVIVFLHGIGSSAASWEPLLQALPGDIRTIAWDAPGYGESDDLTPTSPHPIDYARALAGLLDALGVARTNLVGHSLGSLLAASFAATYPERVDRLALLSPALGYRVPDGDALPPQIQARLDDLERLGAATYAARSAPRLVSRPELKPQLVLRIETIMASVRPSGYARAARALAAGDLLADAATIATPTLVGIGADDVVTPPANARRLHETLRRSGPFLSVPDAGHALPQEAPHLIADRLSAFIGTHANA